MIRKTGKLSYISGIVDGSVSYFLFMCFYISHNAFSFFILFCNVQTAGVLIPCGDFNPLWWCRAVLGWAYSFIICMCSTIICINTVFTCTSIVFFCWVLPVTHNICSISQPWNEHFRGYHLFKLNKRVNSLRKCQCTADCPSWLLLLCTLPFCVRGAMAGSKGSISGIFSTVWNEVVYCSAPELRAAGWQCRLWWREETKERNFNVKSKKDRYCR